MLRTFAEDRLIPMQRALHCHPPRSIPLGARSLSALDLAVDDTYRSCTRHRIAELQDAPRYGFDQAGVELIATSHRNHRPLATRSRGNNSLDKQSAG